MPRLRGRRLADTQPFRVVFEPGDYLHDPRTGSWWALPPQGQVLCLDDHIIQVHDDGTITVKPEVKALGVTKPGWIGRLVKGVWLS